MKQTTTTWALIRNGAFYTPYRADIPALSPTREFARKMAGTWPKKRRPMVVKVKVTVETVDD